MVTEQQQQQQQQQEVVGADDDMYYGDGSEADVDDLHMSGLSIQSSESDASTEPTSDPKKMKNQKDSGSSVDDDDDEEEEVGDIAVRHYHGDLSLPGSPAWSSPRPGPGSERPEWLKDYASETEARAPGGRKRGGGGGESSYFWRNSRRARESRLERTWEMRRGHFSGDDRAYSHSAGSSPCVVVHPRGGGAASICMDMDEVRACRDLGLECDWTVEIPPAAFQPHPDTTGAGAGDSPVDGGRTSSPRDDQRGEVKARLRVWAQAVALASRLRS